MTKKFDYIFVDLDSTIYDTRKFREDMFQIFSETGISREEFFLAYREAAEAPMLGYFNYTFEKQIDAIRNRGYLVPENSLAKLYAALENNYLYAEAPDFLLHSKKICEKLILLTAGNYDFQRAKIDSSKISSMIDQIIQIDGGKDLALEKFTSSGLNIAFINDNLDENIIVKEKFVDMLVVTKFNPDYWAEEECEKSGLPWFRSLKEISRYLENPPS